MTDKAPNRPTIGESNAFWAGQAAAYEEFSALLESLAEDDNRRTPPDLAAIARGRLSRAEAHWASIFYQGLWSEVTNLLPPEEQRVARSLSPIGPKCSLDLTLTPKEVTHISDAELDEIESRLEVAIKQSVPFRVSFELETFWPDYPPE